MNTVRFNVTPFFLRAIKCLEGEKEKKKATGSFIIGIRKISLTISEMLTEIP